MLVDEEDKGKEEEVGVGNKHSKSVVEGVMEPNERLSHGDEADKVGDLNWEAYKSRENSNHNSPSY